MVEARVWMRKRRSVTRSRIEATNSNDQTKVLSPPHKEQYHSVLLLAQLCFHCSPRIPLEGLVLSDKENNDDKRTESGSVGFARRT